MIVHPSAQAQIAAAETADALAGDMAQVVIDYMVELGVPAAQLRRALNDAIVTAACETAAGDAVAASTQS